MKFQFATLLVLAITLFSSVFANTQLVSRHTKYPVQANSGLSAKIFTKIEAQVQANVFAHISASFSEKVCADLDVKASLLNGAIKTDIGTKIVQKAAIHKLKTDLEADLRAKANVSVYAKVEAYLKKQLGSDTLTEKQLLKILIDVEAKLKETLKVELPKIGANLNFNSNAAINLALKKIAVDIPHVADVEVKANVDAKVAIKVSIDAGLKVCAKLNATQSAKAIIKSL